MKLCFEKKKIDFKNIIKLLLVLFFLYVMFILIISVLARFKPVFQEKATILAKVRATEIINSAVLDVFSGIESENFVNISKTDTGEVKYFSTDTIRMNKLKSKISQTISEKSKLKEEFYVYIPMGSLTKYPVLQGMGYRIPIRVSLDGVTNTNFHEEYINSGINQVKNKIYILVTARISIISSFMTVSEVVETEIPVSETIIVGEVPNYYGDKIGVVGR